MSERLAPYVGLPKSGSYIEVRDNQGVTTIQGFFFAADETNPLGFEERQWNTSIGFGFLFLTPYDSGILKFLQARLAVIGKSPYREFTALLREMGRVGYPNDTLVLHNYDGTWVDFKVLHGPRTAARRGRKHKMQMPKREYDDVEVGL